MDILDIPREFPQFGKHLSSLLRPRGEVFKEDLYGCRGSNSSCGDGRIDRSMGDRSMGDCGCSLGMAEPCACDGSCGCDDRGGGPCADETSSGDHGKLPQRPHYQAGIGASSLLLTHGVVPNRPIERICGPDATDYVARQFAKIIKAVQERGIISGPTMVGPGADIDLKGRPFTRYDGEKDEHPRVVIGRCPTNCGWAITLCGKCVSNQIPGNMGLGMYGRSLAETVGWVDNVFMAEKPEDRASYFWGAWINDTFLEFRLSPGYSNYSDIELLRALLCAAISTAAFPREGNGKFIPGLNFEVFPCGECAESQPVKDREVKRLIEWRRPGPSGPEIRYIIEYEHGWAW